MEEIDIICLNKRNKVKEYQNNYRQAKKSQLSDWKSQFYDLVMHY